MDNEISLTKTAVYMTLGAEGTTRWPVSETIRKAIRNEASFEARVAGLAHVEILADDGIVLDAFEVGL